MPNYFVKEPFSQVIPGTETAIESADEALEFAKEHGLPIILKAAHGGGGRGMRVVREVKVCKNNYQQFDFLAF